MDGCGAEREEYSRNKHFGKCPHFCIHSGHFAWDNRSVSYLGGGQMGVCRILTNLNFQGELKIPGKMSG